MQMKPARVLVIRLCGGSGLLDVCALGAATPCSLPTEHPGNLVLSLPVTPGPRMVSHLLRYMSEAQAAEGLAIPSATHVRRWVEGWLRTCCDMSPQLRAQLLSIVCDPT